MTKDKIFPVPGNLWPTDQDLDELQDMVEGWARGCLQILKGLLQTGDDTVARVWLQLAGLELLISARAQAQEKVRKRIS